MQQIAVSSSGEYLREDVDINLKYQFISLNLNLLYLHLYGKTNQVRKQHVV